MRRAAKVDDTRYLGGICARGHEHEETGMSLRKVSDRACVVCCRENAAERYRRDPVSYMATRNKDAQRAYVAAWKRAKRAKDPEAARQDGRQRYQRERLKTRLRNRLRKALVSFSRLGKIAKSSEYADFMAIIDKLGPCPGDLSEWEIDHIKPLSSFDFNDPEQVRAAFLPENHQWLLAADNRKKHAKTG